MDYQAIKHEIAEKCAKELQAVREAEEKYSRVKDLVEHYKTQAPEIKEEIKQLEKDIQRALYDGYNPAELVDQKRSLSDTLAEIDRFIFGNPEAAARRHRDQALNALRDAVGTALAPYREQACEIFKQKLLEAATFAAGWRNFTLELLREGFAHDDFRAALRVRRAEIQREGGVDIPLLMITG